jgi:hypothetical protein
LTKLVLALPKVQFAVANDSYYLFSGVMGLGYAYPYTIKYRSVLDLMVSQNKINGPIFSLGLGGEGDNYGMSLVTHSDACLF